MQRARRLASVVVVAALGVTGLSACEQSPGVAAYLGPLGQISEHDVQVVWDDAHQALEQAAQTAATQSQSAPKPVTMPITRADILTTLIGAKVLDRVAQGRSLTAAPDKVLGQDAQDKGLPPTTRYMQAYAHWDSLVNQLKTNAAGVQGDVSDTDLKAVYDTLVADKAADPAGGYPAWKSQVPEQNKTLVKVSAAARDQIQQVVDALHVKVNPRYQPATLPVLNFQSQAGQLLPLLTVPLGRNSASAPVSDAS